MLTEATLRKGYALIDARDKAQAALDALLGNGVDRPKAKVVRAGKAPISAKQKKARALQGKFMGAIRNLNKKEKAQVSKVRVKDGMAAAIKAAKAMSA